MSTIPVAPVGRFGSRDMLKEARVRRLIQTALAAYFPIAMLTKTEDDDRILLGLMMEVNDPVSWEKWVNLLFGPR